jgi:hypothetical protein
VLNETTRRRLYQRAPSTLREATIQDPPLTDDGFLRVEVDGAPGAIKECPWPRVPGAPGPAGDDAALVVESDGGNWWVVAWWAQGDEPPPDGGGASVDFHEFVQITAVNPWVIPHGLGRHPAGLATFDTDGIEIEGDVMAGSATYV